MSIDDEIKELVVETTPYGRVRIVSRDKYFKLQEEREKMDMRNPGGKHWVDISGQRKSLVEIKELLKDELSYRKKRADREAIRVEQLKFGKEGWIEEQIYEEE